MSPQRHPFIVDDGLWLHGVETKLTVAAAIGMVTCRAIAGIRGSAVNTATGCPTNPLALGPATRGGGAPRGIANR